MRIKHTVVGAGLLVGTLALAACGSDEVGPADGGDGSGETTSVTYLTSFGTFGRDAYALVAQEKGYFEEAGLDVTIEPGSGSVDVMELVSSGTADFGVADFSAMVVTVANEKLPVTATAAIHQRSLAAILTLEEYGISEPADLVGKRIGDQPGSTVKVIFPTYAKAVGIDPESVEFVPSSPQSLPQVLAANQVDAIGQFVVGKSLIENVSEGRKVVTLSYGDVLPELYGMVLITSDETAESDPELVRAFTDALLRGLEYSIANPDESAEILKEHDPTANAEVAASEIEAMAPYVTEDGEQLGHLTEEKVTSVIEAMQPALTGDVAPEDLVSFDLLPE